MPIVTAGHNAGYDQNEHHSPVESQTRDPRRPSRSTKCGAGGGRISAAVQSICLSSSRGCIGNSTRPISDGIGRMAQPPVRRCMSRNNVRVLAFGGLHVTLCCTYWGWPDYSYSYRSVVRPELFSICCLSASVDEIFTWCATAPGCMGVWLW